MEFNIWCDRLPDLTSSQININPRLQPTAKTVSPIIVVPHARGPSFARSKKLEPTIRAAITRRTAMRIVRPIQLATVGLLLARQRLARCSGRGLAPACNVCPEPDNFVRPAVGFPQEARLVLHPKVVAVLASKPVLLHQVALGHQDRRFLRQRPPCYRDADRRSTSQEPALPRLRNPGYS